MYVYATVLYYRLVLISIKQYALFYNVQIDRRLSPINAPADLSIVGDLV
jgi:hypothetical protein